MHSMCTNLHFAGITKHVQHLYHASPLRAITSLCSSLLGQKIIAPFLRSVHDLAVHASSSAFVPQCIQGHTAGPKLLFDWLRACAGTCTQVGPVRERATQPARDRPALPGAGPVPAQPRRRSHHHRLLQLPLRAPRPAHSRRGYAPSQALT